MKTFEKWQNKIGMVGILLGGASVCLMMAIQVLDAIGRKVLVPFPVALELSQALMISTVFFSIGYVALRHEHTYVTLPTRNLHPGTNFLLDSFGQILGAVVFSFLTYAAWFVAIESFQKMEIIIGVLRFPIWIFKLLYALGLMLFVVQVWINAVKFAFAGFEELRKKRCSKK
jgi:TRAP-type C4-dicarboxylate transport system permease small subunit